ncbi:MAG: tRNA uridine-5-carboxymethylaminomethyl(34) synthesis enzyme MnmG, partial [Chitinophagales bacterium]
QDNADLRLTPASYRLGLASQERMDAVLLKRNEVERIKLVLANHVVEPRQVDTYLDSRNSSQIQQKQKAIQLLLRPDIGLQSMIDAIPSLKNAIGESSREIIEQAEIQIKYDTYINKEKELVQKMSQLEELNIPEAFDYDRISSLSTEAMQKFKRIKPRTLGQASRISGVNPSDIQILMVYMGR